MDKLTELQVNWTEIKEKLKFKFRMVTESDPLLSEIKQEEMLNRLQARLGRTKEEIKQIISDL